MTTTTRWTRRHLDLITEDPATTAPPILGPAEAALPGLDLWDMWAIQDEDGTTALFDGRELWMGLTAPALGHPEDRHDVARIRLLALDAGKWIDLGNLFPDEESPGSREWSGTAIRRPDGTVSVFYTATGHRGEPRPTFVQRVIEARLPLGNSRQPRSGSHREIVRSDSEFYLPADDLEGGPGNIRAFRDPAWFRGHLLIAASIPWGDRHMGAIALTGPESEGWPLRPPLLIADGINREIERPHIVTHNNLHYLFFCTHHQSFEPPDTAPTGLYGFVSTTLDGPYEPLNGSGLVIANPATQPDQAYAWMVLDDLRVVSFLDYRGPADRTHFGGTVAPLLKLHLEGNRTHIEPAIGIS
ncbi:glycoside hydrolase family 68 protein [Acrocarpospora catenulata]|uniref:glycoside hydrolase family 68 protein n=1 Tax=Acrocarpospora catenulata TaxID=2836182 RepID=UPI001BDA67D8|nr:glycoside hydrolase family 68 protein [Acrocarpospora catenulata]